MKKLANGKSVADNTPTKLTSAGRVLLTQDQIDARAVEVQAEKDAAPLNKWKVDIAALDTKMPRWMEDHIKYKHSGVAGSPYQQSAYDEKKELRAAKPE